MDQSTVRYCSKPMLHPSPGWLLFLLLVTLLVGCGGQQSNAPSGVPVTTNAAISASPKKIKAVTTTSVLADMIKNVGGDRVEARNIIPIGAGPEDYQPTPQDAQMIAGADIVFYNGHGLEAWLDDLFKSAARPNQPHISVSENLQAVDVGNQDFKQGNPHFWMSAAYGVAYAEKIRDGLIQVDPDGKALYTKNAETYLKQLTSLNEELKKYAATIPAASRKMVTNHDAFPYFAQEYGFIIVGNVLRNPESESSAGDLAKLVQDIRKEHVKAVFTESQFSPKLTRVIAEEAGVSVIADLYTDTLGDEKSGVATYIDMLRFDMKTIVEVLKS